MSRTGRTKTQVIIWSVGLLVTFVMIGLGLWQANAFRASGEAAMVERMTGPEESLQDHLKGERGITGAYGLPVTVEGHFLPDQELLAQDRVVSAFMLPDGRVLPVVRGNRSGTWVAPPPDGDVTLHGILLPSEGEEPQDVRSGVAPGIGAINDRTELPHAKPSSNGTPVAELETIPSVRLAVIAQSWPQPMHNAFLTVTADTSLDAGLDPSLVPIPDDAEGRARNQGYALQWWVFAIVALAATIKFSSDAARGTGFMAPRNTDDVPSEDRSTPHDEPRPTDPGNPAK